MLIASLAVAACSSPPAPAKVRIASGPPLAWGADADEHIKKSKSNIYSVHAGDTLWAIAAVHDVELEDLAKWNDVDDTDLLRIGQKLRLTPPPKREKPKAIPKPAIVQEEIEAAPVQRVRPEPKPQPVPQKPVIQAKVKQKPPQPPTPEPTMRKKSSRTWKLPRKPPKKWLAPQGPGDKQIRPPRSGA